MIDIPIGKALVPVESPNKMDCPDCCLYEVKNCYKKIACRKNKRKDGKNVIFKLVD